MRSALRDNVVSRSVRARLGRDGAPRVVGLSPAGAPVGRALLSYLREPATWAENDPRFAGHTNNWESRQIARLLVAQGYAVDLVQWTDAALSPARGYDLVMGIDAELDRLADIAGAELRLLHATTAHPAFQNSAELDRLADLERRRGIVCAPRRASGAVEAFDRALRGCDGCSLIGNEWTRSTYPVEVREKIAPIPVTGSLLRHRKGMRELTTAGSEFLWFFGAGAVHKGLDRVLDVFAASPDLRLNVVGNIAHEPDFLAAYDRELTRTPNIAYHGMLDPSSRRFRRIAQRSFAVVAPSCSEGTSPATVTMLQLGLLPIIGRATGITLPAGCGRYLETSTPTEIEEAVRAARALDREEIVRQTAATQRFAAARYCRASFSEAMNAHLERVLPTR